MPKFLNKDLAELAHQLTLSPRRLRMEQIHGIGGLLDLVEEDKAYPFDLVCYHITRYRKRGGSTSASILGKDLIRDLVTIAEVISRKAALTVAELGQPYKTQEEVADRLKVSTKTVRRWRDRGLLGVRVVFEDGVNRLAFCDSMVERFVTRKKDLVSRGASFKQLTDMERQHMVERARELRTHQPLKLHAAARIIADEMGRAVETVRYTLRRHEESSAAPLFATGGHHAIDERYLAVWRCHEARESVSSMATAFDRTEGEIEAILRHVQVVRWRENPFGCVYNELFDAPNADALILEVPEPPGSDAPLRPPPKDTLPYLRSLYLTPLLTSQQEQDVFRRYNYLKWKTSQTVKRLDPDEVTAEQHESLTRAMGRIDEFKQRIIRANLRLVVSIARKHVGWSPNFFEIISDGNMSLMRAIEKFDYARGNKFSTYATWAIVKNYARSVPAQRYLAGRYVTGQDELLHAAPDKSVAPVPDSDREHVRKLIAAGLSELNEREREIVSGHFGLGRKGGSLTLEQLGERFGVTKERIRQIEQRALAHLREVLAPSLVDALAG